MDEALGGFSEMITRGIAITALALTLIGCDTGFRQMGPTEYGLKFRKIPTVLGGGIADKVISPREMVMVLPWETSNGILSPLRMS